MTGPEPVPRPCWRVGTWETHPPHDYLTGATNYSCPGFDGKMTTLGIACFAPDCERVFYVDCLVRPSDDDAARRLMVITRALPHGWSVNRLDRPESTAVFCPFHSARPDPGWGLRRDGQPWASADSADSAWRLEQFKPWEEP